MFHSFWTAATTTNTDRLPSPEFIERSILRREGKVKSTKVTVSCVLLTICLLALLPRTLDYTSTWKQVALQESDTLWVSNYLAPLGFSSLAIITIALTVIWTGYRERVGWTWFVLF